MGKILSRLALDANPDQHVSRHNHREPATTSQPDTQGSAPLTLRLAKNVSPTDPNVSTDETHLVLSSSHWDDDQATAAGSVGTPISPRTTGREPAQDRLPFRSARPDSSPAIEEQSFRTIVFGEKTAVQVVSAGVREVLKEAATGFLGVQDTEKLFSATSWIAEPYEPIVHNRTAIERRRSEISDPKTKRNLDSLLGHLDSRQPGLSQKHAEIESGNCQKVLFHHALLLYPPGRKVYRNDDGQMRAYVIGRTEMITRKKNAILQIQAWYLDFDSFGRNLVPHPEIFELPHYASERMISELELKPDWFMKKDTFLDDRLIARGLKHWDFREKRHYKEYQGDMWPKASYDSTLRFKTWRLALHEDFVGDVEQKDSFEHDMYMNQKRKESLESLVSAYAREFNLVADSEAQPRKSRGMNILLIGGAGTGKTLTAECLAEKFGIPLYSVTPGDLGVHAGTLDRNIQTVLQHARNWKAIVLFDDADVYVAGRNGHNLERAALLPTFLRHLESSDCLSFISVSPANTDRDIDPAVYSRIHAQFSFNKFVFGDQQRIWQMAIDRLDETEVENKADLADFINNKLRGLDEGAHIFLNGRQIRNYMDVALVIARNDSSSSSPRKLRRDHIKTVLRLGKGFRDHVTQNGVNRVSDSDGFFDFD
ncbi:hypothetical protein E8E14_009906 [Neopestalotiopsis sp. 37M]|nr:hypothetical protein E8E14_009906 [Neopestalotiopsis sp. 37M]